MVNILFCDLHFVVVVDLVLFAVERFPPLPRPACPVWGGIQVQPL